MKRQDTENGNDDLILELEDDVTDSWTETWDITTDFDEAIVTESNVEEETTEAPNEEKEEEATETTDAETVSEEDEEDIDLSKIFAELDDANETIDKIETTTENKEELSSLKDSLNTLQQLVKKLSNEKADLIYKNAELEAFGSDNTDPKILLLSRNLVKAKSWDEQSKTKTISILKDMLYDLTWEDIDNNKINKDIDLLSSIESYNANWDPNLSKSKKETEDDFWISI